MIIVGVDFSAGSAGAATVALRMAVQLRDAVRLVHVRNTLGGEPWDDAGSWLDGLGLEARDVEMGQGVPWAELVRRAGAEDAMLLVVGTHGLSGFQPLRLGRTAELIVLRSPVPVVLVPPLPMLEPTSARTHTHNSEEERGR